MVNILVFFDKFIKIINSTKGIFMQIDMNYKLKINYESKFKEKSSINAIVNLKTIIKLDHAIF